MSRGGKRSRGTKKPKGSRRQTGALSFGRYDRRHTKAKNQGGSNDSRSPSEKDRDRILYAEEFQRLSGITQVVPPEVGYPLHNRLTHVLEVAQVGRRLAERIIRDQEEIASELGVDPNVVEAACLAHDLGHPPFGHVAEDELNKLADDAGSEDGFEGNAQSFRVVTKLSVRREGTPGLDLTRATLNAILKYPWVRGGVGAKKKKWGAYSTEIDDFKWARRGFEHDDRQSAEAALMDIADDIAYSVHDMADFFRAGKLPLDRLVTTDFERDRFFDHITKKHPDQANQLIKVAGAMFDEDLPLYIDQPFNGSISQRSKVKSLTSLLIGRYVSDVELQIPKDDSETTTKFRDEAYRDEIAVLKELTWCYVIADNSLGLQQLGQRKIIQGLFKAFRDAVDKESWHLFPRSMRAQLESLDPDGGPIRVVTDLIAGMDEEQAASTYQQVTGISLGSGLAAILR